jgi:hypothetical protein
MSTNAALDAMPNRASSQGFMHVVFLHCLGARSTAIWSPPDWVKPKKAVPTTTGVVFPGSIGDIDGESRTPLTLCLSQSPFVSGRNGVRGYVVIDDDEEDE